MIGILGVAALGAIAGRSWTHLADSVLEYAENYPRTSNHVLYGRKFVCNTNADFALMERCAVLIDTLAQETVVRASLPNADAHIIAVFLVDGILSWGAAGTDVRAAVLRNIDDVAMKQKVGAVITSTFYGLPAEDRQMLQALHILLEE